MKKCRGQIQSIKEDKRALIIAIIIAIIFGFMMFLKMFGKI